ncbi:GNAT family N-acetyltransferase [Cognatishimia sp. F0-27]|nr:GNAT family N-acetyltransferase [Cognatishimia sp. F0-27]MCC1491948.1 GNAT family N-acetyltransferase [Cognatishimia sp. F0-27]
MPRVHTRAEDLAHAAGLIDRGWVRVACVSRQVVGFLARENHFVHALYIAPEQQRCGLGQTLLADAQAASDTLELWTFEANHGAQRFYERAGFVLVERGDGSTNDEGIADRRYVWESASTVSAPDSSQQGAAPANLGAAQSLEGTHNER